MEPGVPFPLLAGVELLTASTALGLGVVACTRRVRSTWAPALVLGALLLAVAEVATAVTFGASSSSGLLWVRAAAFALVAVGLWPAGRQRVPPRKPRGWVARPGGPAAGAAGGSLAVVVPLGGDPSAAAAATLAGLAAALVALDHVRDGSRARRAPAACLAVGLALAATACALAPLAESSRTVALAVLGLRAAGALALVVMFALLARFSVLGKVVGAMVVGVLTVSVTAVTLVGTAVEDAFERNQDEEATAVADGRVRSLLEDRALVRRGAELVGLCPVERLSCEQVLRLADRGSLQPVAAVVEPDGEVRQIQGTPLSEEAQAALREHPTVQRVTAAPPGSAPPPMGELVRLEAVGAPVSLLGVAAPAFDGPDAGGAGVWLVPVDDAVLQAAADLTGGYGLSVLVDGQVVSSSLSPEQAAAVQRHVEADGVLTRSEAPRVTLPAHGSFPVVRLSPLPGPDGEPVALLAVSRSADAALHAEREALSQLLLVTLALTVALAAAAALLGHRLVQPVHRLTAAATRVSRGDLSTRSEVGGEDEVGALARAFDAMTASLARLTGDLRTSAAEEARLRANLETVLASLSDGVVAVDEDGRVTRANAAALALAGVDAEAEVRGLPLADVLPLQGVDLADRHGEGVLVRADGGTRPVAVAAAPLAGGGGRVLVVRDQTREREVERMKTEFLSNVSHELRTPLTPIRGYADLLLRRPGLPPEQSVLYAAAILDACLRLTKVVDLLVDVAALEAGRVVPELRSVPARELLEDRVEAWRRDAPERAADLRLRVEAGLPPLCVDPFWLGRALDELIDNAVKHTPPGTVVTVSAETWPDGSVALGVHDAGPGIPAEESDRLLGSFEQADASATRAVGGLGLGLAFVRRLAEDFGLQMRLDTERGWGTAVTLVVPSGARQDRAPVVAV